jgi:hypothetical protein
MASPAWSEVCLAHRKREHFKSRLARKNIQNPTFIFPYPNLFCLHSTSVFAERQHPKETNKHLDNAVEPEAAIQHRCKKWGGFISCSTHSTLMFVYSWLT